MATFAWATDIHLDFLGEDKQRLIQFGESLIASNPTGIVLTGDLSVARQLVYHLSALEKIVQRPIYFVLGNHDYYGSSIEAVRKGMRDLAGMSPFLRYMPTMPYMLATPNTALVGHDGWYDALIGDWQNSSFNMTDWYSIHDFLPVNGSKATIVAESRKLAHAGVTHVQNGIKAAVKYVKEIVVLTHFPPYQQSHVHQGQPGEHTVMPWFTSKMMGDMLLDASKAFPHVKFRVLCGHTHGKWDGQITNNLSVHVGAAEYNKPQLQGLVELA